MALLSINTYEDDAKTLRCAAAFLTSLADGVPDNVVCTPDPNKSRTETAPVVLGDAPVIAKLSDEVIAALDEMPAGTVETVKTAPAGTPVDSGAADTTTSATTQTAAADSSPDGVDHNGVEKNAEFCGNAASPFYGSGKRKGQWKKRQGVADEAYDEWYAEERAGCALTVLP